MKLCLIGSSRFLEKYMEVNRKLSLAGHVVYSIATVSSSSGKLQQSNHLTPDEKETLDLVHLLKIQESDACFLITDPNNYVGESTKREMKWAVMQDMAILGDKDLDYLIQNITEGLPDLAPRAKDS